MESTIAFFILCLAMLVYVYAGYPLVAWWIGRFVRRPVAVAESGVYQPSVTVIIAAFNEAGSIADTVRNKLEQDYPPHLLDVIVVSDESDDGTDELVRDVADHRVRLMRQSPRAGKTAALNLAVPEATGDILVFSDANSLYAGDTVANLVLPLADPEVGYVTGRMVYKAPDGSLTGEGCSAYMQYENKLRAWETNLGSIVGVDGGVDAMRREIYRSMNFDQLPDFVQPLTVREQGYRVVYQPTALLYEDALADTDDEFRMRVRVTLRAWHALKDKAVLLNPLRFGLFAFQLWSHKVLRYLAFAFMAGALVTNWILASRTNANPWPLLLIAQVVFYATAIYGQTMHRNGQQPPRLVGLVHYLCVLNLAGAVAFWKFLRGEKQVTWKPRT